MKVEKFNSIQEILTRLEEPNVDGGHSSTGNDASPRWDLGAGYDGAVALMRDGWADGVGMVSDLLDAIDVIPAKGDVMVLEPDYTGPVFDMSEYLTGNPECHFEVNYELGPGQRYLDLYFPLQLASGINGAVSAARATASVALVDAIEAAGIRCRVSGMSVNKRSGADAQVLENMYATIIQIKDYDEALHLPDAVFMLGHPAFKRRIVFALWERSEHELIRKATNILYGNPQDPNLWAQYLPLDDDAICFPKIDMGERSTNPETHLFTLMMALPEDVRDLIETRKGGN